MDKGTKIIIGLLALVGIGMAVTSKKGEAPDANTQDDTQTGSGSAGSVALNLNLVLKKGSRGQEVAKLQDLLGATADGIFGPKTENLLMAKKGVKEISLSQYAVKMDVNHNSLAINTKVMAYRKPSTTLYNNKTLANGTYTNLGTVGKTIGFGDEIGTIVAVTGDRVNYVVWVPGYVGGETYWVRASDVAKI